MINLPKIQALIAPFATPTGPAMFLSNEFYKASIAAGIPGWIGLFIAITTIVGVEFSGALMCYCAIEAWQRQSWGKMWLAVIGASIYGGIMFIGFASLDEHKARIFGVMVLLTLVAYLGYAIYHSFGSQEQLKRLNIQETNAQTRLTNAETRKIKAESSSLFVPVRPANERERDSVRERIYAVLSEQSEVGPREMSRTIGCSVSTASKWIKQWKMKQ